MMGYASCWCTCFVHLLSYYHLFMKTVYPDHAPFVGNLPSTQQHNCHNQSVQNLKCTASPNPPDRTVAQYLKGYMTLCSLWGWFVTCRTVLTMVYLPTKFEVSSLTHSRRQLTKWCSLEQLAVKQGHWKVHHLRDHIRLSVSITQ